jgi:hypothetical protein
VEQQGRVFTADAASAHFEAQSMPSRRSARPVRLGLRFFLCHLFIQAIKLIKF